MGIQVEFNPDLALRKFGTTNRHKDECFPENLEVNKVYNFLKEGQRNYWFGGEIPLLETKGNQQLSRPLASVKIIEATHLLIDNKVWTKGKYLVIEVFDSNDNKIHFEGLAKIVGVKS